LEFCIENARDSNYFTFFQFAQWIFLVGRQRASSGPAVDQHWPSTGPLKIYFRFVWKFLRAKNSLSESEVLVMPL
jgi:hypothetical protein